jgi:tetratricopeptide (TPR) repeat protein
MTRLQRILVAVIVLEAIAAGVLWDTSSKKASLPAINWDACLIEGSVANQIRDMEARLVADRAESWAELAATYRAFGLFPQAEYCYRRINKLAPPDRSYLYYWAECLGLMGRVEEGTKLYERIIKENLATPLGSQTRQYCWLNIGQNRLREENVDAAVVALRKAGDISKAKFLLARIFARNSQAREAVKLLDELLREGPDVIEYNQMKSWAEAELGNQEAAQEFYERSLRCSQTVPKWDPTYAQVVKRRKNMGSQLWHEKSLELETQGKLKEALEWSRKAVAGFWTEDRAQQLAKLEMLGGNPTQAIAVAEESNQRVGASAKTLDIIGVASIQLGDRLKAQRVWEQAAELEPTPNLYWKLAELGKLAGDPQRTRKYQALEQYQAGKEKWLKNDLKSALEFLEKSVSIADNVSQAWFYLGETRRLLADRAGAEMAYQRCLALDPDHGRALRGVERLKKPESK